MSSAKNKSRIYKINDFFLNSDQEHGWLQEKAIFLNESLLHLINLSNLFRYVFMLSITFLAIGIKYFFLPPFDTPYLLALSAVMLSSLYCGFSAGIASTIITLVFVNYLFIPEQYVLKLRHDILIQAVIYVSQGVLVSFLIERERVSRRRISDQASQLHVTLASIGDAVIVTDIKGKIMFMNKIAESLTGWKGIDAINKKLDVVFNIINEKTKKKATNPVKKAIKINKVVGLENHTLLVKKNGNTIPIDDSAAPINDSEKRLIGVVLVFRDVTQRRELEQRKDDFVSIVSHELKTPITSIKLFIQLLKRKTSKKGEKESVNILEKVDSELDKLAELVSDFLDLSRIQSGKLNYKKETVLIDDLAKEIIGDMQKIYSSHKIILEGEIGKNLYIDKNRIKQVLINLISNAVKYSNNKNKIIIRLEKDDDKALVKVQDFGMGISKEQQGKIFNRFYQANTKRGKTFPGLGLGLYVSSEIIKGHNGKIWVESEIGKGSVFQFLLPLKV